MRFMPGEINIICSDARRSLDFYVEVLGFNFVEEERGASRLENGGLHYLLLPFALTSAPDKPYCHHASVSFDLLTGDHLAEVAARLAERGVVFEKPYVEGQMSFVIRDPDNLCIEIIKGR